MKKVTKKQMGEFTKSAETILSELGFNRHYPKCSAFDGWSCWRFEGKDNAFTLKIDPDGSSGVITVFGRFDKREDGFTHTYNTKYNFHEFWSEFLESDFIMWIDPIFDALNK